MALDTYAATLEKFRVAPDVAQPCGLVATTTVLTLAGERRVQDLAPGDRIITRDSGTATLKELHVQDRRAPLYCLRPDALGKGRPGSRMLLPEGQRILVRDWRARALFGVAQALVPVGRLADGEYITRVGMRTLRLHTLVFAAPHIIYAGGLELAADVVADMAANMAAQG